DFFLCQRTFLTCIRKSTSVLSLPFAPKPREVAPRVAGGVAVLPKTKLAVEVLEGQVVPAVSPFQPPGFMAYAAPTALMAPLPFMIPPAAPRPISYGPVAPTPTTMLSGSVQGQYASTLRLLNTPSGFHFSGSAKFAS